MLHCNIALAQVSGFLGDIFVSSINSTSNADAFSFARTIAGVKQGMADASNAQSSRSANMSKAGFDLVVFSKANLEAVAHSGQVYAAGLQDLMRDMIEAGQTAMHEALANMRALTDARTPKAAIEVQAAIARTAATHAIATSARIAQSGADLAERTAAPLVARMVAAAELTTAA